MFARDQYIQLLASLPQFAPLFSAKQTPLSRLKLDRRLKMLTAEDQQRLQKIERLLEWDELSLSVDNETVSRNFHDFLSSEADPQVIDIVTSRLDIRTLVAALVQRANDQLLSGNWTASRLKSTIERHWLEPTFHLEHRFPWLTSAQSSVRAKDYFRLEALLFEQAWQTLRRHPARWHYGFCSVVLYVLQWDLVSRWVSYDQPSARQRFDELLAQCLALNPITQQINI
ncbi:hypothetical protein [Halioxenophilus sp. WMMB6]|uniref:hypothetical protein n=1 Tax=Halioxenophilus sp. WMMB6 TaxID=3073815 RepID=UPI00295F046E|nr:hypothetical protein [Halioxenophilus sp. WMMB6]